MVDALENTRKTATAARAADAVKIYGSGATAVRALDSLTVEFDRGRFSAIMGPSGSGKSTLLHCLAGLDRLTEGSAWIGEVDITGLDEKELTRLRRDKIGFIFQAFNLVPTLSASENITLPLALANRSSDRQWIDRIVEMLKLSERMHHKPHELSGGEQQRVASARALASKPEIVFADEPTGNLDSRRSAELLSFMRTVVDDLDQTIIMVTHDPVAASNADRVVFLADGKIVDSLDAPNVDAILERIKTLEG